MESIAIQSIGVHCITMNTIAGTGAGPGQTTKGSQVFHYNAVNESDHRR